MKSLELIESRTGRWRASPEMRLRKCALTAYQRKHTHWNALKVSFLACTERVRVCW